jgi:hypothetical protein
MYDFSFVGEPALADDDSGRASLDCGYRLITKVVDEQFDDFQVLRCLHRLFGFDHRSNLHDRQQVAVDAIVSG